EGVGGEELQVLPGLPAERHLQRVVVRCPGVFLETNTGEVWEWSELIDRATIQRLANQWIGQISLHPSCRLDHAVGWSHLAATIWIFCYRNGIAVRIRQRRNGASRIAGDATLQQCAERNGVDRQAGGQVTAKCPDVCCFKHHLEWQACRQTQTACVSRREFIRVRIG